MTDIVERLRETIVARDEWYQGRLKTSDTLLERLSRERHEAADEIEKLRAALKPLPPIEQDKLDPSREYIPLPGGWEIQTKGRGSSYRLCDTKTGERHMILAGDIAFIQDFVTRMAKEIHAAAAALKETGDE